MKFLAEEEQINPLLPSAPDLFWSLIVLVIIAAALWKIVIPKFTAVVDERTRLIEGGIEKAKLAEEQSAQALKQYQDTLNQARDEAAKIREEARAEGKNILAQLKTQAQTESERIVESGKKELEVQRSQLVNELRSDLGKNSVILAEKLIGHDLSEGTKNTDTINRFITELEATR